MANASPNATYIPPARVGWLALALGPQGFSYTKYRQRKSLAFGVLPNATPQRDGVAVEYIALRI